MFQLNFPAQGRVLLTVTAFELQFWFDFKLENNRIPAEIIYSYED